MNNADLIANDWKSADYLTSEQEMALYLQACCKESDNDPVFVAKAVANVITACKKLAENDIKN